MVAVAWLAPGAFAYWSSPGEGSASANLATLSPPAISSATPGAQTVELTWSAVTPPASGTVEYFVTRDGGAPGGGCPTSGSSSTATSCTDTGMSVGTHEYTVTAVWRTWTATSTAKSVAVAFGPATHLLLEAASTTPTAGEADNLTITAKDASNNTVATYSGTHSLIFEGAGDASNGEEPVVLDKSGVERSFGEATEITFAEGKATVSSATNGVMQLYKAEAAPIMVKEGSLNNGAGLVVTVKAASTKKFAISALSEQTAAVAVTVTLTATDEYGNATTSYAGSKTLAWSGPSSSPNSTAPVYPASSTTVTFTAGVGKATGIKLYDAQSTTLKVTEGPIEGISGSFTVKAAATKKFSVPTPGEQEAGVAFNVTLTATDEYGNTATSYVGAKTLAWSGPGNSPSPFSTAPEYPASATTVTFANGVGTASEIDLYAAAAAVTLTVKEGAVKGTSGSFTVKAGSANSFSVPTPSEQTAGTAFNVKVTAIDEWGNTAKSYAGSKTLVWSGPSNSPSGQAPSYPSTATTVIFTAGAGTATTIKLYDAQSTTLTATEGTIAGATGTFTIKVAATKKFSVPTPSEQEAGVAFNVTLTATDEWGNLTTGYAGAKTLVFSEPSNSPGGQAPEYPTSATTVTFTAGVGTAAAIKLYDAQSTTLKAKEGATVVGTSAAFTVRAAATTKKFTVPTPSEQTAGTAFNVTLTATDEWGNKTTGYTGSKTLVWSGPSNSPSGQAPSYPSTATTVIFTAGEGTATTITPYDAQSTTLTATEGTIAGTSGTFTVKAGAATKLAFTTSPSTPTAENTAFTTQPKVTVQDAWQNTAATNISSVTLTPSGATLTCTANPKAAVAGVATFAGCKMKTAGTYTLTAADGSLTSVVSNSFTIS